MLRKGLFKLTGDQRFYIKLFTDLSIFALTYYFSFLIRFGGNVPARELQAFLRTVPIALSVYSLTFLFFGLYKIMWRYSNINDLRRLIGAISSGMLIFILFILMMDEYIVQLKYPRSIFFIYPLLMGTFLGGTRFFYRIIRKEKFRKKMTGKSKKKGVDCRGR